MTVTRVSIPPDAFMCLALWFTIAAPSLFFARLNRHFTLNQPGVEVDALGELRHVFVRNRHRVGHHNPLNAFSARRRRQ
jgi:hypothetical protein